MTFVPHKKSVGEKGMGSKNATDCKEKGEILIDSFMGVEEKSLENPSRTKGEGNK